MSVEIKILGTGSASPIRNRRPSGQYINFHHNHHFLVDCGEGTQFQLLRYRISHTKITHIFITHLHGDHFFGLIGLISSMHLVGRQQDLHIYAPVGVSEILLTQLKYSDTLLNYKLHLHEIKEKQKQCIAEFSDLQVFAFPLNHRIDCFGYIFREKPKKRRLQHHLLTEALTPVQKQALKNGEDIVNSKGECIRNDTVTLAPKRSLSYAYCSDTAYFEELPTMIEKVDLLYHEATFDEAYRSRAISTFHSTASDAANVALQCPAEALIIGHFSSRYKELDTIFEEAKAVFPNTQLAEEGKSYFIHE
ncbi:MAG: ribonuclease Z [Cytophagaceae bacterium]|nr:ribonuclease Z [Cytophagaceae bacterium]